MKREARHIGMLADFYAKDGLCDSERRELEARSLYIRSMANRPGFPDQEKKRRKRGR